LQIINFLGVVYTGQGGGKFFVEMPWVMQQLQEFTGFKPYSGTLNLRLTLENITQRVHLTPQNGILIKPKNGYLPGYLYKAKIFDTDCYVILPDVPSYPKDVLEIIAAENLRDKFNFKDGDIITVLVTL
jgi:riboflavin kinase